MNMIQYETEEKKMKQLQQKTRKATIAKQKKRPQLFKKLIIDKNVSYYTGLCSKELTAEDTCICCAICSTQPLKFGPKRFLDNVDELLLELMRFRLGLDLADLKDRFFYINCISQ